MKNDIRLNIPITKVDDEQKMVYGWASTPDLDSDGEIVSLEALSKALPKYMQYPTIREMHQPRAAGTTKNAEIVDDPKRGKGMYIGAKIVADEAWRLIKEGVYKGFSIGGHVTEKVKDTIKGLDLIEISLVDVPANRAAAIELWKRDFTSEERKTLAGSGKAMPDGSFPIVTKEDLKNAIQAFGRAKNKAAAKKHIIRRARALGATDMLPEAWKSDKVYKQIALEEALIKLHVVNKQAEGGDVAVKKKDKAQENEEVENEEEEENAPEGDSDNEDASSEGSEGSSDSGEGAEDESSNDESDGDKESNATVDLKKIEEVNQTLDKINKVNKADKLKTAEAIKSIAGTLGKIAETMDGFNKRIRALENQPAAPKSKASYIKKSEVGDGQEDSSQEENKNSGRIKQINKRLEELDTLFTKLGPNKFAKGGYSLEAGQLKAELSKLQA